MNSAVMFLMACYRYFIELNKIYYRKVFSNVFRRAVTVEEKNGLFFDAIIMTVRPLVKAAGVFIDLLKMVGIAAVAVLMWGLLLIVASISILFPVLAFLMSPWYAYKMLAYQEDAISKLSEVAEKL